MVCIYFTGRCRVNPKGPAKRAPKWWYDAYPNSTCILYKQMRFLLVGEVRAVAASLLHPQGGRGGALPTQDLHWTGVPD